MDKEKEITQKKLMAAIESLNKITTDLDALEIHTVPIVEKLTYLREQKAWYIARVEKLKKLLEMN